MTKNPSSTEVRRSFAFAQDDIERNLHSASDTFSCHSDFDGYGLFRQPEKMQCHFLGTASLFIRGDSVHSTQDSWLNSRIGITCGSGCSDCFRYGSDCCSGSDFSDCSDSGSGCCSGYGFPFEKSSVILFAVFRTFSIPSYKRFIRRIYRRQANRRFL